MTKIWSDSAWADYLEWQTADPKMLRRVNELIRDTERDPFRGLGKPEPLKGDLSGWWSRNSHAGGPAREPFRLKCSPRMNRGSAKL